jgi:uncharacterized protein (TIGR03437 family)
MSALRRWKLAASWAAVLACAGVWSPRPAHAQSNGGFQYSGIIHVSWWFDEYTYPTATASRNELATTNANWASVLVTWYQDTTTSTVIAPVSTKTPTDAAVRQAIQELHSKGLKVMLKPHVDPSDGQWRGNLNPADINAWFASYTQFIVNYAQMAGAQGVEALCMGTELKSLSGSANQARWYAVIDAIRAVYGGTLTYAANATSPADEFTSVSFWDRLDLIGLDGYFNLTDHNDPTLAELVAAWRMNRYGEDTVAAVKNFYDSRQKPIIFTEIGYKSVPGANQEPWNSSRPGVYDPTEQRNCLDAAFTVWSQWSSWMQGFFWWAWPVPAPGPNDTDYNPRGKPAEDVLRAWQAAPDSHSATVNAASYGVDPVAPGAIVSLFGPSLTGDTAKASSAPLPTVLAGASVTFNGVLAPLFFASPQQINAQVPFEMAPAGAAVEVTSKAGISLMQVIIAPAGPGIFTTNGQGTGEALVIDAVSYAQVTAAQPIAAGGWIQIYCTGLGAAARSVTTGDVPPSPPPETIARPEVRIDGRTVTMSWSGLAPGFVGLNAVNAQVPADVSAGTHQLQIVVAGVVSNTVTFSVR